MMLISINFYWVYDLPNWSFAALTIAVFVLFGLGGLFATRTWVRRLHKVDHSHNDIVGFYLAAVTVFYGITLGLVAVGTWNTFSSINDKVDSEAQVISSLYRDITGYPEPFRTALQQDLQAYVKNVIEVSWPQQRKGIVPGGSAIFLNRFQRHLFGFSAGNKAQEIIQAEAFKQYNELVEYRRSRLNAVHTHLPSALWTLVIVGGLISIIVTFFFDTKSFWMHFWLTSLLSALLGLLIFLVGTMDNPFRGGLSVSAEPLQLVYHQLLKPEKI